MEEDAKQTAPMGFVGFAGIPNNRMQAGIAILEAAIHFFETYEEAHYPAIVKVLKSAIWIAKML